MAGRSARGCAGPPDRRGHAPGDHRRPRRQPVHRVGAAGVSAGRARQRQGVPRLRGSRPRSVVRGRSGRARLRQHAAILRGRSGPRRVRDRRRSLSRPAGPAGAQLRPAARAAPLLRPAGHQLRRRLQLDLRRRVRRLHRPAARATQPVRVRLPSVRRVQPEQFRRRRVGAADLRSHAARLRRADGIRAEASGHQPADSEVGRRPLRLGPRSRRARQRHADSGGPGARTDAHAQVCRHAQGPDYGRRTPHGYVAHVARLPAANTRRTGPVRVARRRLRAGRRSQRTLASQRPDDHHQHGELPRRPQQGIRDRRARRRQRLSRRHRVRGAAGSGHEEGVPPDVREGHGHIGRPSEIRGHAHRAGMHAQDDRPRRCAVGRQGLRWLSRSADSRGRLTRGLRFRRGSQQHPRRIPRRTGALCRLRPGARSCARSKRQGWENPARSA